MHPVQTTICLVLPLFCTRTRCKFGSQRRLLKLWAWLTLLPTTGPLPQISQRLDISFSSCYSEFNDLKIRNRQGKVKKSFGWLRLFFLECFILGWTTAKAFLYSDPIACAPLDYARGARVAERSRSDRWSKNDESYNISLWATILSISL